MDAVQQFSPPFSGLTCVSNFKHVKKNIFLAGQSGCDFDAPASGDHVLAVGAQNLVEVFAPKQLPHAPKLRIVGQGSAFGGLEWPVFARTPGAAVVIAGRVEFISRPSTPSDNSLRGKQRMHEQFS